jgi:DNA repair protein SbcC/Rad50
MGNGIFSRTPLHRHSEPAQRIVGLDQLSPTSEELVHLLAEDPSQEVRIAAAHRCADLGALATAWTNEPAPGVKNAIANTLAALLADCEDSDAVRAVLARPAITDSIRADIAHKARDPERRRTAIEGIRNEDALIEIALSAEHAETRLTAAEHVKTPDALRRLADAARNRDHGVHRLARQRIEAIKDRLGQSSVADSILTQLEELEHKPGPILTEMVELNRRWQALDLGADAERAARFDAARRTLQARLDREQEELKAKLRFEQMLKEWEQSLESRAQSEHFDALRSELAAHRHAAQRYGLGSALALLDDAQSRLATWEQEREKLAEAEALVVEAEKMVADTTIDPGTLPERWQALDRSLRTPELTRRFETALIVVEQRRLAHVQHAQQEVAGARAHIHALLHTAEHALAAGQLREARTAVDQIRPLRAAAGTLPKPTIQRLGRLVQQLVELERWQSFGQQNARMQLIERAEAAAALQDPRKIAQEVQQLRNEWKALDQQYAGVPKSLWERFDSACEKAYAPAAKYFTELNAQRKQARQQREQFIAQAAAHAPTLLTEPRDWRAMERWLRETEQAWRATELGSLEPRLWKKLDTELKAAIAPVRDALGAARDEAKACRQQLIEEVNALAGKALERDAPSQVKAIQAKWQEHAKTITLAQRDERALWEQFRAACDAVFKTRQDKRSEDDARKQAGRRTLEDICVQLEKLAQAADKSDQDLRRLSRELQDQWRKQLPPREPALRDLEARFRKAAAGVETALAIRARSRQSAVWDALAAKERLCERLDAQVLAGEPTEPADAPALPTDEEWAALPALTPAWDKKLLARRDAALKALADPGAAAAYVKRIDKEAAARRDGLLELELLLGLDSPPELQAERLALQVKQLRDRFKSAVTVSPESAGERLADWCAQPGVLDARDRARSERVFAAVKRNRK